MTEPAEAHAPAPPPQARCSLRSADSGTSGPCASRKANQGPGSKGAERSQSFPNVMRALNTSRLSAGRDTPEAKADEVLQAADTDTPPRTVSSVFTTECPAPSLAHGTYWALSSYVRGDWVEI